MATTISIGHPLDVIDVLQQRAADQPTRLAYTWLADGESADSRLTYGELDASARGVAAWLDAVTAPGDRVVNGESSQL